MTCQLCVPVARQVLSRVQQQLSPQAMERVKDILLARDQTGTGLVNAQQVKVRQTREGNGEWAHHQGGACHPGRNMSQERE